MELYTYENVNGDLSEFAYNKLKEILNVNELEFIKNEYGKPYLKDSSIYFNISHSNDVVVIVIDDKEVGVDIEFYSHYSENMVDRVCSLKEIDNINNSDNKAKEYIKIWCKKESLIKCEGKGISLNMKNILDDEEKYRFDILEKEKYLICICRKK